MVLLDKKISSPIYFDEKVKTWFKSNSNDFQYSDGSRQETYIRNALSKCKDKSSSSEELAQYIKDWPSEYHLSTKRSTLFSAHQFDRSSNVLEVGCGCGAITRFLGETFDQVTAIEGSKRRAEIAALRVSDLSSVDVLCCPFQDIEFNEKFDLIFCVGVLEYSPAFVEGKNPFSGVVDHLSSLLTPNGTLFIAIENQFGLKYFLGAKEDHTNLSYEGIIGYPRTKQRVQTFGKESLMSLCKPYFNRFDYFFPFPDYKLPDLVVSQDLFDTFSEINFGELVSFFPSRSQYFKDNLVANLTFAWHELGKDNLIPTHSNSFLLACHKGENVHAKAKCLFYFKSAHKVKDGCSYTEGFVDEQNKLMTRKYSICKSATLLKKELISPWFSGPSLAFNLFCLLSSPVSKMEDFICVLKQWMIFITQNNTGSLLSSTRISGKYIDLIPQNIICETSDPFSWKAIDQEWEFPEEVSIGFILFRGVLCLFKKYTFSQGLGNQFFSFYFLIKSIGQTLFKDFKMSDICRYVEKEALFQSMVNPQVSRFRIKCGLWLYLLKIRF